MVEKKCRSMTRTPLRARSATFVSSSHLPAHGDGLSWLRHREEQGHPAPRRAERGRRARAACVDCSAQARGRGCCCTPATASCCFGFFYFFIFLRKWCFGF